MPQWPIPAAQSTLMFVETFGSCVPVPRKQTAAPQTFQGPQPCRLQGLQLLHNQSPALEQPYPKG